MRRPLAGSRRASPRPGRGGGGGGAALSGCAEGVAPSEELGDRGNVAWILEGLGILAGARGEAGRAARLLGAAAAPISASRPRAPRRGRVGAGRAGGGASRGGRGPNLGYRPARAHLLPARPLPLRAHRSQS